MNRLDRLSAILIQLQTKRVVKAEEIAERFEISLRTVYRDVKALMEAGIPVGSEAGKGYFMADGFHLPPVMFTKEEASALVLAGKLVEKMTDESVRREFVSALSKIQAVLRAEQKDHLESLGHHVEVWGNDRSARPSNGRFLSSIQKAVVDREVLQLTYFSQGIVTERNVEPIGLFFYGHAWHLIAWCNLRQAYRDFRIDRIRDLLLSGEKFDSVRLLSLKEYLASIIQANGEVQKIVVRFEKAAARFTGDTRYTYGFVEEEDLGNHVRMTFVTSFVGGLCRWLLMFGKGVRIESPDHAGKIMEELAAELADWYGLNMASQAVDN